jgi:hypothetical protein
VQFINDFRHVRAAQLKRSSSHPEECLKQKLYESYFCFVSLARVRLGKRVAEAVNA